MPSIDAKSHWIEETNEVDYQYTAVNQTHLKLANKRL